MSHNIDMFKKQFDKQWFVKFRSSYETINPDRPMEGANLIQKRIRGSGRL